jgi:hypothetical protein
LSPLAHFSQLETPGRCAPGVFISGLPDRRDAKSRVAEASFIARPPKKAYSLIDSRAAKTTNSSIITLTKQAAMTSSSDTSPKGAVGAPEELREQFLKMLELGNEHEIAVHPVLVDQVWRMAEILGVDTDLIPTERKLLGL